MIARIAERDDFRSVHDLMYQVFERHLIGRPDIYKEGNPYKLEQFEKTLENDDEVIILAIENQEIIGLSHMVKKELRGHEIVQDGINAYIEDFVVDKEYRGKGYGKELFQKSIQQAKFWDADNIELNVWEFNEEATSFYKNQGLKVKTKRMEYKL